MKKKKKIKRKSITSRISKVRVADIGSVPSSQLTVAEMIQKHFNVIYFFISELGPVIGAHVGPGMLGAGICPQLQ